jgi:hypothetical protein
MMCIWNDAPGIHSIHPGFVFILHLLWFELRVINHLSHTPSPSHQFLTLSKHSEFLVAQHSENIWKLTSQFSYQTVFFF